MSGFALHALPTLSPWGPGFGRVAFLSHHSCLSTLTHNHFIENRTSYIPYLDQLLNFESRIAIIPIFRNAPSALRLLLLTKAGTSPPRLLHARRFFVRATFNYRLPFDLHTMASSDDDMPLMAAKTNGTNGG